MLVPGWRHFAQLGAQAGEDLAPALEHETARLDARHQRLAGLDPQLPPDLGRDHHAPRRTDAKRDCLSVTCHVANTVARCIECGKCLRPRQFTSRADAKLAVDAARVGADSLDADVELGRRSRRSSGRPAAIRARRPRGG